MGKITVYLPDVVEREVREAATVSRLPLSRWIADRLALGFEDKWPAGFLAAAGSVPDFPDVRWLRTGYGKESQRLKMM